MDILSNNALKYAFRDPVHYSCFIDGITNGDYEVLYSGDRGVLVKVKNTDLHIISAASLEDAVWFACDLDEPPVIQLLDNCAHDFLMERYGFKSFVECYNCAYTKCEKIEYISPYDIRTLDLSFENEVAKSYHIGSPEEIHDCITDGKMIGAFTREGKLVGFIGIHSDNSVGMLYVYPQYRRNGVAFALEAEIINRLLDKGRIPYCHIISNNKASLALQKKLGYSISEKKVYWLF